MSSLSATFNLISLLSRRLNYTQLQKVKESAVKFKTYFHRGCWCNASKDARVQVTEQHLTSSKTAQSIPTNNRYCTFSQTLTVSIHFSANGVLSLKSVEPSEEWRSIQFSYFFLRGENTWVHYDILWHLIIEISIWQHPIFFFWNPIKKTKSNSAFVRISPDSSPHFSHDVQKNSSDISGPATRRWQRLLLYFSF